MKRSRDTSLDTIPKVNSIFRGEVTSMQPYGIFVKIPGCEKNGLVHISQISKCRIDRPEDVVEMKEKIYCKVISVEPDGNKISLSMKVVNQSTGEDLDPNMVQTSKDEQMKKKPRREVPKIELGAIFDTVCKKCGGKGHFAQDCFHVPGGKKYNLIEEVFEWPANEKDESALCKNHKKKDKKEGKKHKKKQGSKEQSSKNEGKKHKKKDRGMSSDSDSDHDHKKNRSRRDSSAKRYDTDSSLADLEQKESNFERKSDNRARQNYLQTTAKRSESSAARYASRSPSSSSIERSKHTRPAGFFEDYRLPDRNQHTRSSAMSIKDDRSHTQSNSEKYYDKIPSKKKYRSSDN